MTLLIKSTPENRKLIFNAIKAKILKHLEELEKKEGAELKKTFSELTGLLIKGGKGLPVGTIREWKGKKFIKIAPGKWRPKYDSETRGAKLAISALKKKIELCEDEREMMVLVLENRDRFSDKNGNPLPFVQQLSDFISQTQEKKAGKNTEEKTKENEQPEGSGGNDGGVSPDDFNGKTSEAISFLLKRKEGEAKNALYHKDIGYIDIVYGKEGTAKSDGYGLAKIAKFHPEVLDNLQEIISSMTIVGKTKNRIQLESKKHKASIRLDWNGKSKKWLLTAFEKESDVSDSRTDIAGTDNSRKNDTATPTNIATTSIPQSEKKSSAEKVEDLTNKYAPENVETIKNKFFPNLAVRNVEQLLDLVKTNRETGETVKFKYDELHFGKDKYIESGLGIKTWDFDYRNPMFAFPAIGGYISFSEIKEDTFNETLLQHIKSDVEFYEKYKEYPSAVKLNHTLKFVKLLRSYDDVDELWKDFENHKSFRPKKNSAPLSKSIVWLQNYLFKSEQKEESAIEALRKRLEKEGR